MNDRLSEDLASLRIDRNEGGGPSPPSARKMPKWIVPVLVTGALVGGLIFSRPTLEAAFFKMDVETTEVLLVSPAQASVELTSTGYVIPQRVAKLGAKVIGRVIKVNVREGETVKTGQVLFELDATDQRSSLASANARAASAFARVQAAKASASEIEVQWKRQQKLASSGAVASSTVDDLAARLKALNEQAKASEAEAVAARADAAVVAEGLRNLVVTSPMDGTILNKPMQVGDILGPQSPALLEVADFSSLLIECDVPEGRLSMIKAGAPTEIVLDSAPSKRLRGEVVEISPRINRSKATATVKVKFVDEVLVRPDMSARVSFLTKALEEKTLQEKPKLIVPGNALADRGGRKGVFVIDNGNVRFTSVTLGPAALDGFELVDGPKPGTKIVRSPSEQLVDGKAVKEKNAR